MKFDLKQIRAALIALFLVPLLVRAGVAAAEEEPALADRLYDEWGLEVNGFIEGRAGARVENAADEKDLSIGETRLRLNLTRDFYWSLLTFKGDLLGDAVTEDVDIEIRDLSMQFSPLEMLDVKAGRQVLTWGTGDLIFINDMFPKDWQSFFIGRDDEYLKSPSNALKTSLFFSAFSLEIVYTPLFAGSEYVKGERLSYYNPMAGRVVGRDMIMAAEEPNRYFSEGEIAGRLAEQAGGIEAALYAYSGFWQEPEGFDPDSGLAVFPRLNVFGASIRSSLLGGVGNLEAGYYDSIDDEEGNNPFIRPNEFRLLAGFERELARELTGAAQYYLEVIDDYDAYRDGQPDGAVLRDEYRHLLTMRLTKLLMGQNLRLSLFVYYSPSDNDGYARPKAAYQLTDHWKIEGGGNIFWGEHDYTFWGRFEDNSNVYAALRYGF